MASSRVVWVLILLTMGAASRVGAWPLGDRVRGEGPIKEERRAIARVDAVELATIGTLFVEQADSMSLSVSAQENLLEYLETDVHSGVLVIRTASDVSLQTDKPVEYHLTVPRLDEIVLSSSGDAVLGPWRADAMSVLLQSSGDLECDSLAVRELEIELQSSGDVTVHSWHGENLHAQLESSGDCEILDGQAQYMDVQISSSGDFLASDLECRAGRVSTQSSGNAEVRVTERLKARSSSSGDVIYYGSPEIDARTSSSGDIVQRRR